MNLKREFSGLLRCILTAAAVAMVQTKERRRPEAFEKVRQSYSVRSWEKSEGEAEEVEDASDKKLPLSLSSSASPSTE